ncbi:hypothetical protein IY804_04755 [Campylobacter volucris]|uniref:hypothetical protein n=1 Tax=Campylobacter volucris TaxID=1031542 RepID=UPI00189E6AC2|nr:hypothetical protein [Campylobacter volucris]MBF7047385.1 hypothetical protein [Campylobacter volucris]
MIDKKYRTPKYFLRAKYPQNANDIGYVECYQAWFLYGTAFVHKYVELLHKQLIRKGRAAKTKIYHPLFPNSYGIDFYDIKSPSRAPYNYHNSGDLGLNQFFVGQNPYEWYRGDPGDKSGIYHDTCEIVQNAQDVYLNSFSFGGKNVVVDSKYLLKYKKELKHFYYLYEVSFDDIHGFHNATVHGYGKPKHIFTKAKIIEDTLIKPVFKLPDKRFEPKKGDLTAYYKEFLRLNKDVFIVPETIRIETGYGGVKSFDFLQMWKENIEKSKFGDIFHPLAFLGDLENVVYCESVVLKVKRRWFGMVDWYLLPCYNNESNMPYGRKDRWFILWDSMYELHVEEDKEWWQFIIAPVVAAVIVFISYWTGGVAGGALSGMIGGASATIISNITALSTLGDVIDALGILGVVDNKSFLAKANQVLKLVLAVAVLVGARYKIGVDIKSAIANQTPVVDALFGEEVSSLEVVGFISDIFTGFNLKEASLPLDSANGGDSSVFLGEASKEEAEMITRDFLKQDWYSLDTLDVLNDEKLLV